MTAGQCYTEKGRLVYLGGGEYKSDAGTMHDTVSRWNRKLFYGRQNAPV